MLKFIHTGDVHLGLSFGSLAFSRAIASRRRAEIWTSFERIVRKAGEEKLDLLLLAGDLFEEKYFTLGDIKRLRDIFHLAEGTNIVISAGNHDTLNRNSLYKMIDWPDHVYIFPSQGLSKKDYDDKNLSIYGYSWDRGEKREDIFQGFPGLDKDRINILLIHGDVYDKNSQYLPLDKNYLESLGFNYIALGHIHKPEIFSSRMAYCGSPEPLSFGERGPRGIIQGQISREKTEIDFLDFAQRKFIEKTIDINEEMSLMDIREAIGTCDSKEELRKNFYKIKLEGRLASDINLDRQDLYSLLEKDFYFLEIINKTIIDYDLQALEEGNKNNLIGHFIREMEKKDLNNELNRQALYIGLEVLMKGKVDL